MKPKKAIDRIAQLLREEALPRSLQISNVSESIKKLTYLTKRVDLSIEEYSGSPGPFPSRIRQLSKGSFRGQSTEISLPDLTLTLRSAATKYLARFWLPDAIMMDFPLSSGSMYANGRKYGPQHQFCSTGAHEGYAIIPESYPRLIVAIPLAALPRLLNPATNSGFRDAVAGIGRSIVDETSKRAATDRLLAIFRSIENAPTQLPTGDLQHYSLDIVNVLSDYLMHNKNMEPAWISNHEKILHRILTLIENSPTRMFTLEEMARQTFASKRCVQYAVSSILGLSPMRLQKMIRLNQIREDLKDAASPVNFNSVISRYSFSNPGRMAKEYMEFFGEHSRNTLRHNLSGGT